jgi:hypothetical protein
MAGLSVGSIAGREVILRAAATSISMSDPDAASELCCGK